MMKKIFVVALLLIPLAAFGQQTPFDQYKGKTLQFRDPDGNIINSKLYFGPEMPRLDFNEIRTQLKNQLNAVILPAGPISVDSVDSVVENIRYVLHLVSLHITRENRLLNLADFGVIYVSSPPMSFGIESLDKWLNTQGCIKKSVIPIGAKDGFRGFVGRTSYPLQVPISVELQLTDGGISVQQLPMFLDSSPDIRLLPGANQDLR